MQMDLPKPTSYYYTYCIKHSLQRPGYICVISITIICLSFDLCFSTQNKMPSLYYSKKFSIYPPFLSLKLKRYNSIHIHSSWVLLKYTIMAGTYNYSIKNPLTLFFLHQMNILYLCIKMRVDEFFMETLNNEIWEIWNGLLTSMNNLYNLGPVSPLSILTIVSL